MHTHQELIEVALPLDVINVVSAHEKSIHHSTPVPPAPPAGGE